MKSHPAAIATIAFILCAAVLVALWPPQGFAQLEADASTPDGEVITLIGASQYGDDHVYTRTLRKFAELVEKYSDRPVEFKFYLNSELGLEKDFFLYMSQGIALDFGIVSSSHMSTFSPEAPLMDMPFLFRDQDHWEKVMAADAFAPIQAAVLRQADVRIIGFAGGGVRNMIVSKPVKNMGDLQNLSIRVMGAPIQTRIFQAIHAAPTVIAYNEIYNAMQTGVIDAAENESVGIQQMKFYEVGPEISLTQHAITVRPIAFSGKTYRRLPADLQAVIERAGREAGEWGRDEESRQDAELLVKMEQDGKLRTHAFADREEMLRLVEPVKEAYAREIDAADVLARINAVE